MGHQDTSTAVRDAFDRLIKVIRQEYQNELNTVKTDPNEPLPAPKDRAIFSTWTEPSEAIKNFEVATFLIQDSARTQEGRSSSGGGRTLEKRQFNAAIVTMFEMKPCEPINRNGKELNSQEVMRLRAQDYAGAMDECVRKYSMDGQAIHDIELVNDAAASLYLGPDDEDSGLLGVGACKFEITQATSAPSPRPLP